jgi:hypothetical protein
MTWVALSTSCRLGSSYEARASTLQSPNLIMSTIASPRVSTSVRSPSLTRTSIDSSSSHRPPQTARRNRAALREFYGLKASKDAATDTKISEESSRTDIGPEEDETLTELDAADFNAEAFVEGLFAREGLKGVLKVEADLVSRMLLS